MKQRLRRICYAVLLTGLACAAVFCWRLGYRFYSAAAVQRAQATLHCDAKPLLASAMQQMEQVEARAEKPVPFALWAQLDNRTLETPQTGRSEQVSILLLCGDSRLVLPVSAVLARGDTKGCIIDKHTAVSLFGNENAAGAVLRYDQTEYVVRGVFASPSRTMLLQVDDNEETALNNVTIADAKEEDAFVRRHGLDTGFTLKNEGYAQLAALLCALPAAVLAGWLLSILWHLYRLQKEYPVRHTLLTICLFAVSTLCILGLLYLLPPAWIPPRWSDFDFWESTFTTWKQQTMEWIAAKKYRPDLLQLEYLGKSATAAASAQLLLALRSVWNARPRAPKRQAENHFVTAAGSGNSE